jgi:hypothetical protein
MMTLKSAKAKKSVHLMKWVLVTILTAMVALESAPAAAPETISPSGKFYQMSLLMFFLDPFDGFPLGIYPDCWQFDANGTLRGQYLSHTWEIISSDGNDRAVLQTIGTTSPATLSGFVYGVNSRNVSARGTLGYSYAGIPRVLIWGTGSAVASCSTAQQ